MNTRPLQRPRPRPSRNLLLLIASLLILLSAQSTPTWHLLRAADPEPSVRIAWEQGSNVIAGAVLTVSFPEPMIAADAIETPSTTSPLSWSPELTGTWVWKSQTEGRFKVGAKVRPGTRYELHLAKNLHSLTGAPLKAATDLGSHDSPPFEVSAQFETQPLLGKKPRVGLSLTYKTHAAQVPNCVFFQDRDTRRRYAVEAEIPAEIPADAPVTSRLWVTPREDLPPAATIDLLVENLREAQTSTTLPALAAFPIGTTEILRVQKVWGSNTALHKPRIHISFNEPVSASEGSRLLFEPPVTNLLFTTEGRELIAEGPFDPHTRYRVLIPATIAGQRGYSMQQDSRWSASFPPKPATLLFPERQFGFHSAIPATLHRRSEAGLRFPLLQVNTGELHWRLAPVPPEKLAAVTRRLLEFTSNSTDPATGRTLRDERTGTPVHMPTELLVESSHLDVLAEGTLPASFEDTAVSREIAWSPAGRLPTGPCLLEVSSTDSKGARIGNRALLYFTDLAVLQKNSDSAHQLRITSLNDGTPLAGVLVRAVTGDNRWITETRSDNDGIVRFARTLLFPPYPKPQVESFLVNTPHGTAFHPVSRMYGSRRGRDFDDALDSGLLRLKLVSDRPLYRPAQDVRFKGFARIAENNGSSLQIPAHTPVHWQIEDIKDSDTPLHSAETTTDAYGGFEGQWSIPDSIPLGRYRLRASLPQTSKQTFSTFINVQEFRPPPFTVDLTPEPREGALSALKLQSRLFHGAPNAEARVRWSSTWREIRHGAETEFTPNEEAQVRGEGVLAADGTLLLEAANPFTDQLLRGWFKVSWTVDVTGVDGQTVTEPAETRVHLVPLLLSTQARPAENNSLLVQVDAWTPQNKPAEGTAVEVELTRILEKTVREQIAPHVYRAIHTSVRERQPLLTATTPLRQKFPVPGPGHYEVVARIAGNPSTPPATDDTFVTGDAQDAPAEFRHNDDTSLAIKSDKDRYRIGDTAVLAVAAPFAGRAWVSLECNESILSGFEVDLASNAGRIEIPIKPEHFPNVWASVHLLRPAPNGGLPSERIGEIELSVERQELDLQVATTLTSRDVAPGEMAAGTLTVTALGKPVADADITLYAVDDALLVAGAWRQPELKTALYPRRFMAVQSAMSKLELLAELIDPKNLTQKGFIIGDGDENGTGSRARKSPRKNFLPIAHWQTGLRTDSAGHAAFSFKAPDSLTRYRIVALAQTLQSQFGVGTDAIEVSKKIQIEPALPRFIRNGDQLQLRAIVRQKLADSLSVTLECKGSPNLTISPSQTRTIARNEPAVFVFPATIGDEDSATITFSTNSGTGDSVEMQLPVHPPTLLRREAVFRTLGPGSFQDATASLIPARWERATGRVSVSLSTSPWLPKLTALPMVLEYPHGCFEQISSRILAYTVLGDLIAYLPDNGARDTAYRTRVSAGLEKMASSLSPDGQLPYWPGSAPAPFASILGCWAAKSAAANGWDVPPRLTNDLPKLVRDIALGRRSDSTPGTAAFNRCFALMVLSSDKEGARELEPSARDLHARRGPFTDEARAFLAVAMHQIGGMETQRDQLLREIDQPLKEIAFDPDSFTSTTRVDAIRAWAFATTHPEANTGKARKAMLERISASLEDSRSLSTQENFWLLMAFRVLHEGAQAPARNIADATPQPDAVSKNAATAAWNDRSLAQLRSFNPVLTGSSTEGLSVLLDAQFRMQSVDDDQRLDRGLRLERVVVNRTEPARTGTAEAPYKLGDELLITFRLLSPKLHHYVAIEGELPACLETLNPNIPSVARSFQKPVAADEHQLALSFSELRDKTTCLYFNRVTPGTAVYSTLARVTSAGTFTWPPAQAVPMYDSRFSGLSGPATCHVTP